MVPKFQMAEACMYDQTGVDYPAYQGCELLPDLRYITITQCVFWLDLSVFTIISNLIYLLSIEQKVNLLYN